MTVDPALSIADILERWPDVVEVLIRRRLGCVGCAMAPYDTLADIARIYELDLDTLRAEVEAVIARAADPIARAGDQ